MHSYTFYYTLHLVTNPIKSLGTPKNIHYKKQFSKKNEKWFHGNFVCVRVNLRKYHTVHCVLIWNKFRESNIFTKWKLLVVDLTNHFFGQSKFFIFCWEGISHIIQTYFFLFFNKFRQSTFFRLIKELACILIS